MRIHNIFGPIVLGSKFNYCKNTDLGTMHIGYQLLQILIAFPSFGKQNKLGTYILICQEQFSKYDKVSLGLIEMTHEIKQIYHEISPIISSFFFQNLENTMFNCNFIKNQIYLYKGIDPIDGRYGNMGFRVSKGWIQNQKGFWLKNQYSKRKLSYFVNRSSGELSKSAKI